MGGGLRVEMESGFVYTKVITVISSNASLLGSGQDTDNLLDQTVNAMMVSNYAPTGAPDGSLENP